MLTTATALSGDLRLAFQTTISEVLTQLPQTRAIVAGLSGPEFSTLVESCIGNLARTHGGPLFASSSNRVGDCRRGAQVIMEGLANSSAFSPLLGRGGEFCGALNSIIEGRLAEVVLKSHG